MNIKEVKDLIQEILQSDISEFELEHTGTKVKLRRGFVPAENTAAASAQAVTRPMPPNHESGAAVAGAYTLSATSGEEPASEEGLHIITSPIVGTFYRAPAPGAETYVKVGAKIEVGTILCIVEAMKLMNEIPSDIAGEVVEIFVENGHPVEFGQKLFSIRPRK